MNKKSKLLTFMASFIPGLSHLYLGFTDRALIFFILLFASIIGTAGVSYLIDDRLVIILFFVLPVIWFVALIDSLSLAEKLRLAQERGNELNPEIYEKMGNTSLNNRKIITIAFAMIPGAGHMYLGLLREGIQLMTLFFFTSFLMGWLNMSLLVFILPVIWFYSLFDAYHKIDREGEEDKQMDEIPFFDWFNLHPKWVGWGLIIFGCLITFEKILSPMISWEIRHYMQTGIVSLIFILGGIKMLAGSKTTKKEGEDVCDSGE